MEFVKKIEDRAREVAQMIGLSWKERVAMLVNEYKVRANVAAKILDPFYVSGKEAKELVTENYTGTIDPNVRHFLEQTAAAPDVPLETKVTHVALQLKVPESIAAELLYKYVKI